jgi:hypothetical protein
MTREASRTVSLGVLDDGARYRLGLLAVGIAASCPPTAALWHQVAQAVEGGHLVFELPADATGDDVRFFADQVREAIMVVCERGREDLPGRELVVLSNLLIATHQLMNERQQDLDFLLRDVDLEEETNAN